MNKFDYKHFKIDGYLILTQVAFDDLLAFPDKMQVAGGIRLVYKSKKYIISVLYHSTISNIDIIVKEK